jgi:hypothetical protein
VLLRQDPHDPASVIAIAQPCHGWVAGQLARAWGNETVGGFAPREEVCLAAEQHDLAWAAWEHTPSLNAGTGLPHAFSTLPLAERLAFWRRAAERLLLPQSRYAALLVSLHTTRLHAGFDAAREGPEVETALRALLNREEAFRQDLLAGLRANRKYAGDATDDAVDRNYRLLATWDRLSLMLCGGVSEPRILAGVPTESGEVDLAVSPEGLGGTERARSHPASTGQRVGVRPWPFTAELVRIVWEGRRLRGPYASVEAMRDGLRRAEWVTGEAFLIPAG